MIIIPAQGGTYRHSRARVTHLLAESGQKGQRIRPVMATVTAFAGVIRQLCSRLFASASRAIAIWLIRMRAAGWRQRHSAVCWTCWRPRHGQWECCGQQLHPLQRSVTGLYHPSLKGVTVSWPAWY